MATGAERDDGALRDGLGRWVAAHPGQVPGPEAPEPRVVSIAHAHGGLANETVLVDLGPGRPGIVVRLAPLVPTFPAYELAPQAAVQNAVAASGVPAPAPAITVEDEAWLGSPFLVMPLLPGVVPGPAPVLDPYVRRAGPAGQRLLHHGLIDTVAAVHAVDWMRADLGGILPGPSLRDAVERWTAYVEWSSEGEVLPGLAEAMDWCTLHVPAEREPVLLWGDVRLGNLVFDGQRRVAGVLDWDLAAVGPREMDLGWHLGLEYMMETLFSRRVGGFPDPAQTVTRYEHRTGYEVRDLLWHEVFALVRALAIHDRHQRITGDPARRENPMGTVLTRLLEKARSGRS